MKKEKRKTSVLTIILLIIIVILTALVVRTYWPKENQKEFKQVGSQQKLEKLYKGNDNKSIEEKMKRILTLPVSLFTLGYDYYGKEFNPIDSMGTSTGMITNNTSSSTESSIKGNNKDYSTTNIQVENVDEADITKTDGDYIYSLSGDSIVISDVRNIKEAKVLAKFQMKYDASVQELLLYGDKLVAIGVKKEQTLQTYYRYMSRLESTYVEIFDITDKQNPKSIKTVQINSPYFTCRAIENNIYVLSSGTIRNYYTKSEDKIDMSYVENGQTIQIPYTNMYYMEDMDITNQVIIAGIDLNNINSSSDVRTYFIDMDNAYVSENNIYIAETSYHYRTYKPKLSAIFGLKGIFGAFDEDKWEDEDSGRKTTIYKFGINGMDISYIGKVKEKGQIVNQFSMDEYNGNLRVATYDKDGTKVNVYDSNMVKLGETESLAKGEKMYSSRFLGNKAYLVTYKTVDPLYVIDLSNPKNPKALGELKIPGYSTYLHPYDEDHIIGIGMETKEIVRRGIDGTIISTSAQIVGMKMALFDVSDVNSPKQISSVVIGNSRTTSAVLTNHKALLFSKEKKLLAIPVNNYTSDFGISDDNDNIDDVIALYTKATNNFVSEGYEVYNIDLDKGFTKKGTIIHENGLNSSKYYSVTHLLRGMYIEDNLYTVSENMIKINKLDTLELLKEIRISDFTK